MKAYLTALLLLGLANSASALDVGDERRYVCRQGTCVNGVGTVFDAYLSLSMSGNWSGGRTIPGATYTLTSLRSPEQKFTQVYGQDGFLEKGDQPRSLGFSGKIPYFRGSYGRVDHPFMRMRMPVPREGVYDTMMGIEYRGRFEFLPAKSGLHTNIGSGYFIFFGDKVDTEDNETESGLYVSDESLAGAPVLFVKAAPSYLATMQMKYQQAMSIAQSDFREKDAEESWRSVLAVVGKVAYAVATGGAGLSNFKSLGADMVMGMVSDQLNKKQGEMDLKQSTLQLAQRTAGDDKAASDALSQAVNAGISSINSK